MSRTGIRRMLALAGFAVGVALMAAPNASQQQGTALPDVQKLGPQVGIRVPDFALLDQKGQSRTLASLMGPKGLMLVFYRSADGSILQDAARRAPDTNDGSDEERARARGSQLRRGAHPGRLFETPWDTSRCSGFGVGNHQAVRDAQHDGAGDESTELRYPISGTFLLNTQGVVTSRFFEQAYQERHTVGSIMARLGNKVDVQATILSSPQLEVTSFATDNTVGPGTQFALVLDVRPARGVHVTRQASPATSRWPCRSTRSPAS